MIVTKSYTSPHRLLIVFATALPLLCGCSASEPTVEPEGKPMREHEKEFDPSKYREPGARPADSGAEAASDPQPATEIPVEWIERSERVMGFRLQLHSTTDPGEARGMLSRMQRLLDSLGMEEGRMDLVFDAPYYKLRYGDYLSKPDADRKREEFHDHGIPNAWVVRDNVVKIVRERK